MGIVVGMGIVGVGGMVSGTGEGVGDGVIVAVGGFSVGVMIIGPGAVLEYEVSLIWRPFCAAALGFSTFTEKDLSAVFFEVWNSTTATPVSSVVTRA